MHTDWNKSGRKNQLNLGEFCSLMSVDRWMRLYTLLRKKWENVKNELHSYKSHDEGLVWILLNMKNICSFFLRTFLLFHVGKKKLISSSKEKVLEYKLEEASEQINVRGLNTQLLWL